MHISASMNQIETIFEIIP